MNSSTQQRIRTDSFLGKHAKVNIFLFFRNGFESKKIEMVSATQFVFTCGRVAVVANTNQPVQRFFRKHTTDLTWYKLKVFNINSLTYSKDFLRKGINNNFWTQHIQRLKASIMIFELNIFKGSSENTQCLETFKRNETSLRLSIPKLISIFLIMFQFFQHFQHFQQVKKFKNIFKNLQQKAYKILYIFSLISRILTYFISHLNNSLFSLNVTCT